MVWNGIIDIITIGYINYCLTFWKTLQNNLLDQEFQSSAFHYSMCIIFSLVIVAYPIFVLLILCRSLNKELTQIEKME